MWFMIGSDANGTLKGALLSLCLEVELIRVEGTFTHNRLALNKSHHKDRTLHSGCKREK